MGKKSKKHKKKILSDKGSSSTTRDASKILEAKRTISKFRKLAKICPAKALKLEAQVDTAAVSIVNSEENKELVCFALCDLITVHRIVYQQQAHKTDFEAYKAQCKGGDKCMSYVETLFRLENGADADIPEVRLELNLRLLGCCLAFDKFDEMVEIVKEALPGLRDCHSSDSSRYVKFKVFARNMLEDLQAEIFDNVVESIVLYFSDRFQKNRKYDHGRDILLLLLEDIEHSWSNLARYRTINYLVQFSYLGCELADAIHYLKKELVMTQEQLIPPVENSDWYQAMETVLGSLGEIYGRQGKIRNSIRRYNEALKFQHLSKFLEKDEGMMQFHVSMGFAYLNRKGNEKLAIQTFEKALSSAPTEPHTTISAKCFFGMWNAYYDIREYYKAILCLKEEIKQYPDEEEDEKNRCNLLLSHTLSVAAVSLPFRQVEMKREKMFQEAQQLLVQSFHRFEDLEAVPPDLTVETLMAIFAQGQPLHPGCIQLAWSYFQKEVNDLDGKYLYCHCCGQRNGASVKLLRCSGCKVKYYCNERHQRMRWRYAFIDHKLVCPFLNRCRKVKKYKGLIPEGKDNIRCILNDFIVTMLQHYGSPTFGSHNEIPLQRKTPEDALKVENFDHTQTEFLNHVRVQG